MKSKSDKLWKEANSRDEIIELEFFENMHVLSEFAIVFV